MFFAASADDSPALDVSVVVRFVIAVVVLAQIVVGVDPWPLLDLAREALPL